jgi:Fe-S cluster assembly protein SufD
VTAHFVGQYEAFAGNGAAAAPTWLHELRERGIARFAEVGFPSTRSEQWRFTNVQPIAETAFQRQAVQWETGPIPRAATVTPFAQALQRQPDLLRAHLARHALVDANPFTALATAFLADGALVHVKAGAVVEQPIHLTCRIHPSQPRPMVHPRLLIVVERGAQVKLVEAYEAAPAGQSLTNAVTEIVLEDGAQLEICREQREGERSYHIATSQSRQGRDSRLVLTTVALGGALVRHDLNAVLDGTGAYLILNGLSVLRGRQHVDHHTTIEHARPHGESHEYFNGVFDGESRGVFNGRIVVRPGAQRTDSKQTNNNLLLSDAARADSQPQLEIYADDVKCTHGSTVGPLDETALFYLKSRGIGAAEARGLLTYGFGADILDRVTVPGARSRLDRQIRQRLGVPDAGVAAA